MRLIDADELIEHTWRDKLDSRELIVEMIERAPTIKEIPTKIPIEVFEKLISLEPKVGYWTEHPHEWGDNWQYSSYKCSVCHTWANFDSDFCPDCGAKMIEQSHKKGE